MPNFYQRQENIPNLPPTSSPRPIVIAGCGGVGFWLGYLLALSGFNEFILFDPDTLSEHNLNRLPFTLADLGKNKAHLLREAILKIRPNASVLAHPVAFDPIFLNNHDHSNYYFFCCVDTPQATKATFDFCHENSYPHFYWIHLACSLNSSTCSQRLSGWTGGNETGGYEGVPTWALPAIMTALLGVYKITTGRPEYQEAPSPTDFVGNIFTSLKL